jgi:hypothetical protein
MNLSPEAFEQVLAELADRADDHQVVDRVPAVRGRARRAARRRAGAVAAAVTVIVVLATGVAGFGGMPLLRGEKPAPATKPTPTGPYLTVTLVRDERVAAVLKPERGGRIVVINVILRGRVPQASTFDPKHGQATDNLRGLQMDWGDRGGQGALPVEGFGCDAGAPLMDISTSFVMTHEYLQSGPETVTFKTGACNPVGPVDQKLSFVVK